MKTFKQSRRALSVSSYLLVAFALAMLLGLSQNIQAQWTTNGNNINNTNTGNVGIGTTTPNTPIHLLTTSVDGLGMKIENSGASSLDKYFTLLQLGSNGYGISGWANAALMEGTGSGGLIFSGYGGPVKFQTSSSRTTRMTIDANGNVGIGTSTPGGKFQVAGDTYIGSNDGSIPYAISIGSSGNGYGGIGYGFKFSPTSNTHTYSANDYASMLQFQAGGFRFRTAPLGTTGSTVSFTEIITGLNNGNVGIGTSTPSTKLHVVGDITVTGNISAKYQDVAEWVPARQNLTPGTVVVLDVEHSNQVTASTQAYDTKVAGVISAQPGVILGESEENKEMVATTGRVKVKVDATRSPIKVGDLLVTSEKEGVAMKSLPLDLGGTPIHRPGTLIGKALEPLEKGTGEILVLLSLQ